MNFRKISFFAAILVVLSLSLTSCGRIRERVDFTGVDTTNPVRGDWFIIHELSDPQGLNPYTTSDEASQKIYRLIFESLLQQDFETLELIPLLAESLPQASPDHLSYTYRLRDGIHFADGRPLTAQDVIFSLKAVKNPLVVDAAHLRNYFEDVKDAVALDERTIQISMLRPNFLAEYYIGVDLRIIPKHIYDPRNLTDRYTFAELLDTGLITKNPAIQEYAEWFGKPELGREKEFLIGSGPYRFDEWRTEEYIKLSRNETYWNRGNSKWTASYADKLVFKTINDRTTAVSAVKNGDIDFIEYVPPRMFEELVDTTATPYLEKNEYEKGSFLYIGWNLRRPILADKRVRQAFSHLVDVKMLINNVMLGHAIPTNTFVTRGRPEYDTTLRSYEYNPQKARQLLAEAGWKDSNGDGVLDKVINGQRRDMEFSFLLNAGNETRQNIALLLVDEFRKSGIRIRVQSLEWSVFLENLKSYQFDAFIGGWVNDPVGYGSFTQPPMKASN